MNVWRRSARDCAGYAWRAAEKSPALERLAASAWVPKFLVNLLALLAVVVVAAGWLMPAVSVGFADGWDTTMEGGAARWLDLTGPAWMYAIVGLVFIALGVAAVPYLVSETQRSRQPEPVLTISADYFTVCTVENLPRDGGSRGTRALVVPTTLRRRDVIGVEPGDGPEDDRPVLVVRRSAVEHLDVPLGSGNEVRIRIRGCARDVPVLTHFLKERHARGELGSDESLRRVREWSAAVPHAQG